MIRFLMALALDLLAENVSLTVWPLIDNSFFLKVYTFCSCSCS